MRIINLTNVSTVELWPGRRLYILDRDGAQLLALPKGQMSQLGGTLSFGAIGRTTVRIEGSDKMAKAIAEGIIEAERPAADTVRRITK